MSLKTDLIALKDQSELMLDLAYSAVFMHNKIIAEQVKDLYFAYQQILERIKKKAFKDKYLSTLVVTLHDIAVSAVNLAKLSESKKMPKIVKEMLSSSDIRVIEDLISFSSFFVDRTIGQLKIRSHTKARIVAVMRNNVWLFQMDKNFKFRAKDLILAVGTKRSEKLLHLAVGISKLEK